MYHFFVEPSQIDNQTICITGEDVNHIKNVLRLKQGDEISVSNGVDGKEYRCGITSMTDHQVSCELRFIKETGVELSARVSLFQGLPKGDKMDLIVQKMTELGVYEIIPVAMQRCIVKLDDKKARLRIARWQEIAKAAAKQSGRAVIPQVREVLTYQEALAYADKMDVKMVPYEMENLLEKTTGMTGTKQMIEGLKPGQSIAVFIGPEGGFAQQEIEDAIAHGMIPITLGRRILRTETAGLTVMAWILYRLEE